jgi:hypothetical protein
MGNKSKKKINSKNKTKKKIKGGRGPVAIRTTGYYTRNASNEPDKLIETIVSNNMDPDRYFDTYGIYPYDNPPSFWEDMTELINFDRDKIDKMKYRLTPFIKPGVNQGIIEKSRIAVVNDEETVKKIKVARTLIAYLNTPAGSALINALMNGSPLPAPGSSLTGTSSDMSSLTGTSSDMSSLTGTSSDMSSLTGSSGSKQTGSSRKRKSKKSAVKKTHKRNKKYYGGAGPKDYKDIFSINRNREDIINGANITDPEEIDIAHELLKGKAFFNTIMKLTGKIPEYKQYSEIDGEQLFNPSQPIMNKIKQITSSKEKQVENMNYSQFKDEFENDKDLTSPQIAEINNLLTGKYVEGRNIDINGSNITISYIDSDDTRLNYAKKAYLLYHKLDTSDIDMVINEQEIRLITTSKILEERVGRDVVLSELEKKQIMDILDDGDSKSDSDDGDFDDGDSGNSSVNISDNSSVNSFGTSSDNSSVNSFGNGSGNGSVNSFGTSSVNSFGTSSDNSSVNSFGTSSDNSSDTSTDTSVGPSSGNSYGMSSTNGSDNSSTNGSGTSTQMSGGAGSEISSMSDDNEYPASFDNTGGVVNSPDNKNLDKAKDFYIQKLKEHGKYKKTADDRFSGAKKTVVDTFSSEESLINKMSKEELQTKMANDKRLEDGEVWNKDEIEIHKKNIGFMDNKNIVDIKPAYIEVLNKYKKIKELRNITEISKINELSVEDFKLKIEKDNELTNKDEILGLANDKTNSDYNLAKAKLKYIKIKNPDRKTSGEKIINSINNETLLSEEINGDTDLVNPNDKGVLQGIMNGTSDDKISTTKREYIRMLRASGKIDKTIGDKTSETWDATKDRTGQAWDATKDRSGKAWDATKDRSGKAWDATKDRSGKAWDATKDRTGKAWDATKDRTGKAWDATKDRSGKAWDATKDRTGKAWDATKDRSGKAWDATKERTGQAWDATKERTGKAWDATKDRSGKAWDATKERTGQAWDATKERVNRIGEAATNRLNSTRLAANRTVANVRQRFNRGGAKNRTRRIKTTI